MRKLASIQIIRSLSPILNADNIEKASVLGWSLVVKKGEFSLGDKAVYFEIDSIVPDTQIFSFLKPRGLRVRTVKLRGQISQGVALPLAFFPNIPKDIEVGADVTELLGIKKYEPIIPAHLSGRVLGAFPSFLHKTDETRIQSVPDVLHRHRGKTFYITEKVDGSSMTVFYNNGDFGVCSRNLQLQETEGNAFWQVARGNNLKEKMSAVGNFAIQGELVGPGVQKNKYALQALDFYVFNVYSIDTGTFLPFEEMVEFVKKLGLKTVPVIDSAFTLKHSVEDLVALSSSQPSVLYNTKREGLIFRPLFEEMDDDLGRLSFKVINPEFLLKHDE